MKTPLGSYDFRIEGNILFQTFIGMFSENSARAYLKEAQQLIKKFDGNPFFIVIDIREMDGATPEAYDMTEHYNQWVNTQHLVAKAIIVKNKVVGKIGSNRMPTLKTQNLQYFNDIDGALAWFESINKYQE